MHDRLRQLLTIYQEGKLTADQREELLGLLNSDEAGPLLAGQAEGFAEQPEGLELPHTEDRIIQGVLGRLHGAYMPDQPGMAFDHGASVRRISPFRRWAVAAAIVLVISGGAYLWVHRQVSAPAVATVPADIAPGGDKAVLTLADGSKITLDSAANGAIARQGGASVVKTANGQIEYKEGAASEGTANGGSPGEGPVNSGSSGPPMALMNTLRTPRGGQYQLTLPDGTKVWLNAASSITYPTAFTGSERKVTITGEAYLEVSPDKTPFFVDVDGRSSVEVLGTSFNVNSYADESSIRTTLIAGKVRAGMVILKPGQQAQVEVGQTQTNGQAASQRVTVINKPDLDKVMAWKNGLFNFEDATLEEVMRQIARWYDVEVVYEKGVPNIQFEGEISRNIKLSDLLKVLARAEVKFVIQGRRLVVFP